MGAKLRKGSEIVRFETIGQEILIMEKQFLENIESKL